jgi:hypothetical protein
MTPAPCVACGSAKTQWKSGWAFFQRRCLACGHRWMDFEEMARRSDPIDPTKEALRAAEAAAERERGWQP